MQSGRSKGAIYVRVSTASTRLRATWGTDPENLYQSGALMAFAGKNEAAVHLIRVAQEQKFCAYAPFTERPTVRQVADNAGLCGAPEKLPGCARSLCSRRSDTELKLS
jgi:hypothetical protein